MLVPLLSFVLITATLGVLVWSGLELFREREDPLADRLEELQSHAMATVSKSTRRRGGGFLNNAL